MKKYCVSGNASFYNISETFVTHSVLQPAIGVEFRFENSTSIELQLYGSLRYMGLMD